MKTGDKVYSKPKGPCADCGIKEGEFIVIRRVDIKGASKIVQLCDKCRGK